MAMHEKDHEQGEEGREPAQKQTYSKAVVVLCLVTIIAFTVTCFVYLWNSKPLNDTLTVLFFGCFGLEFASLAFIKGRKIRYVDGNAANKQPSHVEAVEEETTEKGDQDGEVSK